MADTKQHGHTSSPDPNDQGFELQDIGIGSVVAFFITLLIIVLIANVVIRGIYKGLDYYSKSHQETAAPMMTVPTGDMRVINPSESQKFPEPRLETNERMEINDFRLKEEQTLHSYAWVDKDAGTVRIPIERAMQLTAQRGLPVRPQAAEMAATPAAK
jgi:hypothetical protein